MRKITNIVSSVTYYKKSNGLLFIVYSIALFALSTIELLALSQTTKKQLITESWSLLTQLLPKQHTSNFGSFLAADSLLQAKYHLLLTITLALVFVLLTGLTGSLVFKRRQDIRSFLSLGLKKSKIVTQLLIEALLPVFFSFMMVVIVLLIFQSPYKQSITSTNDQLFANELPAELRSLDDHPLARNKRSQDIKKENSELLLPFNTKLFYHSDAINDSFSYTNLVKILCRTCLLLVMICLTVTAPIAILAVQIIGR